MQNQFNQKLTNHLLVNQNIKNDPATFTIKNIKVSTLQELATELIAYVNRQTDNVQYNSKQQSSKQQLQTQKQSKFQQKNIQTHNNLLFQIDLSHHKNQPIAPLKTFPKLLQFQLISNKVKALKLTNLGLENVNYLSKMNLQNLEELDLSDNQIKYLPKFLMAQKLRKVNLKNNYELKKIKDFTLGQYWPKLKVLKINNLPFQNLPQNFPTSLQQLYYEDSNLTNQQLYSLISTQELKQFTNLHYLSLQNNKITTFPSLKLFPSLCTLYLNQNPLQNLQQLYKYFQQNIKMIQEYKKIHINQGQNSSFLLDSINLVPKLDTLTITINSSSQQVQSITKKINRMNLISRNYSYTQCQCKQCCNYMIRDFECYQYQQY